VIWSLAAPIAMAWIFGSMFSGGSSAQTPTRVVIEAGNNPPVVASFVASVMESPQITIDSTAAGAAVRVELPDGLLAALGAGTEVVARVYAGDAGELRARSVSARVRDALYHLAFQRGGMEAAVRAGRTQAPAVAAASLSLTVETLGAAPRIVTGKEHTLPAMLVMFIMFQLTTFFLGMWVEDLRSGKTRRITMSPTRAGDILAAQIVARLAWGLVQVAIILGVGSLVLGVRLDVVWPYFAAVLGAYMLAAAALGMLMASLFRSTEKANAVGVIATLVMAALGGCWWPIEFVPETMRRIALLLPTGQAMDGLGGLTSLGAAAQFPASNVVVLIGMACIMMPIAARRMRAQMTG
jgi:ABC-2 type transport system permease protein